MKQEIDCFIRYIELNASGQMNRNILRIKLLDISDVWSKAIYSLICSNREKHIAKTYVLEKLRKLKEVGQKLFIENALDFRAKMIYKNLFSLQI